MIPQRILLRGFLCYRDEQEISFESAPLWMLAGTNGSGKSAVFDAMTFALFGGHRGGLASAQALINKDCDRLAVQFDFLLDNKLHQAHRTLKLKAKGSAAGTHQIRAWHTDAQRWEVVPDTTSRAGFDAWVRDNIGLTYETFTSSVLLMQGKAEKLLSAAPKERFEVLAGIVDLGRYQRLHKRADDRRRAATARVEALQQQLALLPEVSDEELAEADCQATAARQALELAKSAATALVRLEILAERWAELGARRTQVDEELRQAESLLAQESEITQTWDRLRELRQVLPALETAVEQSGRLQQAERHRAELIQARQEVAERRVVLDDALAQNQRKRQQYEQDDQHEAEQLREITRRLQTLSVAGLVLRALYREREDLRQARRRTAAAARQQAEHAVQIEMLESEYQPLVDQVASAAEWRRHAEHRVTEAATLLSEAGKRVRRFFGAVGDKLCRYCGQALTAEHVQTKKTKLEAELAAADAGHTEALCLRTEALEAESRLQERCRESGRALEATRNELAACRREQQEAEQATGRHAAACLSHYQELEEPFRARVGPEPAKDWLATTFPGVHDLDALHGERAALEERSIALDRSRVARRQELGQLEEERVRLVQEHESLRGKQVELERQQAEEDVRTAACRELLAGVRMTLPTAWLPVLDRDTLAADYGTWRAERATLEASDAKRRVAELERVRASLAGLRTRQAEIKTEQERIPSEARTDLRSLRAQIDEARQKADEQQEIFLCAQQARDDLAARRTQRQQLHTDCLTADRRHQHYAALAELLGRNRLQLHLVRQAERKIVGYANAVLDRLSGGQLFLRLAGEGDADSADQALQLEATNRATGDAPIGVSFLSGSQRFRVAVSLALGIGQYASRRHRPIESVIIDEGFGCLDRQGRQVMIQELHNLKGQLRCILLVSHQEEFADAFPDGYRFELVDGSTVATRFQPG
jgi:DNA repair exonuclease SbcCD ATPase subunit